MDNVLTKAELKTMYNFMRTDLGQKILANVAESKQGYLDAAVAGFPRGKEYTHDCVVAAAAVETIYQFLKPPEEAKEEPEE